MNGASMLNMTWFWVVLGIFLVFVELVTPGFILIFFGASALVTALINWIFPEIPIFLSILLCAVLGAGGVFLSRWFFPDFFASKNNTDSSEKFIETDDVVGAKAIVTETIPDGRPGKVEFRGSLWNAEAEREIPAGEQVIIVKRKNLTLYVK